MSHSSKIYLFTVNVSAILGGIIQKPSSKTASKCHLRSKDAKFNQTHEIYTIILYLYD